MPFAYTAAMSPLTPKKRSELRAQAHKLNPVVIIGDKGLTDEVVAEIDRALKAHELIKVRAAVDDRDTRDVWLETICQKLEAHPVQQIGKIFVVYREGEEEEKKAAPSPRPSPKGEGEKRRARPSTRTERPRSRTPSPLPASGSRRRLRKTSR
jgi:RNA-binding protein